MQVGKGGMGKVYRAHQVNLNRDVAIKVLSRDWMEFCAENELETESGLLCFRRKVQVMARLRHPYILQIHDFVSGVAEPDQIDLYLVETKCEIFPRFKSIWI